MNKIEFLDELRSKLRGLPKKDLENRINFYDEMISDRMDEGKSEEEAISEIGSVDEIVNQIASETSLVRLVKEKARPQRSLRGFEILLLILGFPLWFPLLLVVIILSLVAFLLVWIMVIVTYVVEGSLIAGGILAIIGYFSSVVAGDPNMNALASSLLAIGGAFLFIYCCIGATKVTLKLSKGLLTSIKSAFIRKGNK